MSHTERERPTGPSGSASLPAAVPETLSASNNQSATNLENPDIVDVSFGQETRSSEKDAEEDDEEDPATSPLLNPTPLIATERSSLPSGSDPNAKNILIVTQKIGSTVQRRITNVSDAEIENIGDWSAEEDGSERPNWTSNLLLVPLDQRWTSSLSDQAKIALKSHWHISYAIWDLYQAGSMTYMPVCGTSCWTGGHLLDPCYIYQGT
ncbi:hypothetical protein BCR34DRAFT_354222 [Clohesyomyces aquaticus]|uniref:Uncharacterized protein n=1 Tax=Clohesyomyces aquaticus TaxID=1231657 RepID=A0A1Y1ZJ36_9PLEO|nr:hypothetical protein BCR34DRAFT_354222 [Clohesyomyces aquaticus]